VSSGTHSLTRGLPVSESLYLPHPSSLATQVSCRFCHDPHTFELHACQTLRHCLAYMPTALHSPRTQRRAPCLLFRFKQMCLRYSKFAQFPIEHLIHSTSFGTSHPKYLLDPMQHLIQSTSLMRVLTSLRIPRRKVRAQNVVLRRGDDSTVDKPDLS
jgi:hypothetical protein